MFINNSPSPIGRGNKVKLNDGDHLKMGEYELDISIQVQQNSQPDSHQLNNSVTTGPEEPQPIPQHFEFNSEYSGKETPPPPSIKMMDFGEDDNYFAPPKIEPEVRSTPVAPLTPNVIIPNDWNESQQSNNGFESGFNDENFAEDDFLKEPEVKNQPPILRPVPSSPQQIKNNQDNSASPSEEFLRPITPSTPITPIEKSNPQPIRPPEQPSASNNKMSTTSDSLLINALIRGLGINREALQSTVNEQFMENTGCMLKETIQGLIEILRARTSLKSEFRASQTTIRPAENNPLKFSPTFDDAMFNMFIKTGQSYLQPVEAVQEAVDDIKAHQLAVMAGFQGALLSLLDKFSPENIISDSGKSTFNKKAKYWDQYVDVFNGVKQEAEDNIQKLLGEEFTKAYEEQTKKF